MLKQLRNAWANAIRPLVGYFGADVLIRAGTVFMCVFVLLTIFVMMKPKVYEAQTLIRFALGREFVYVPESVDQGVRAPNPGTFQDFVNAEILLLDNPELTYRAIRAVGFQRAYPELAAAEDGLFQAALQMESGKSVELITGSYVVKVSVNHTDPVIAADLTNELANAYFDWRREFYIDYERVALKARLASAVAESDRINGEIATLLGGVGALQIETDLESARQLKVHLNSELRDARAVQSALDRRLTEMKDRLGLETDRARTNIEIAEAAARVAYLEQAIAENLTNIDHLSNVTPKLALLQRRQAAQVERVANLQIRLQDSELSEDLRTQENVRVIQAALPPIRSSSMPRSMQLMIAMAVAGLAAAATAFVSVSLGGGGNAASPRRDDALAGRGQPTAAAMPPGAPISTASRPAQSTRIGQSREPV